MRKNCILIWVDELRADTLACFGNELIDTPNIDRLASEGVKFNQAMITQPTCTPCRASVLTACYPSALRSRMVGCETPDDPRFITKKLKENGYRTASIGKIHLSPQAAEAKLVEELCSEGKNGSYFGFDEIDLVNGHGASCFGPIYDKWRDENFPTFHDDVANKTTYYSSHRPRAGVHSYEAPAETHSSNYIAMRTVDFLKNVDDRPFFLQVSFPDPHHPFTAPEPYASMYSPEDMPLPIKHSDAAGNKLPAVMRDARMSQNCMKNDDGVNCDRVIGIPPNDYLAYTENEWRQIRAIYYGMTSLVDKNIGSIMEALRENGLDENTYVVFLSDHGEYAGDYELLGKGFHHDCIIRTPLIIKGPEIPAGREINQVTSVIDIAPTILDLLNIEEPEAIQGASMAPAILGEGDLPRSTAITENDDDMGRLKMRTLTTDKWKFTVYANEVSGELYDRENDPKELNNLWDETAYLDVKNSLTSNLLQELLCTFDTINGRSQSPKPDPIKWLPSNSD